MISRFISLFKKENDIESNELKDINRKIDVSIIISCRNEVDNLKKTIDSILDSKNNLSFEIIIVDDGSEDNSCDFINTTTDYSENVILIFSKNIGIAPARNLGAKASEAKYLFFCDAHISLSDYWLDNMVQTLEDNNGDAIIPTIKNMENEDKGYGGTWNSNLEFVWLEKPESTCAEVPLAPGCVFGVKRCVFETVGGFHNNLKLFGVEDQELSLRLWLFGYRILIDTSVEVKHLFKANNSYKITHADLIHNYLCLAYLHFDHNNLVKTLELFKSKAGFNRAFANLITNADLVKQRKEYLLKRKFNENYFFEKFNIQF